MAARAVGAAALGVAAAALAALALGALSGRPAPKPSRRRLDHIRAARYLNGAASVLSLSVLADSALEHYRGTFHNPGMYAAPVVAAASLVNSLEMTRWPERASAARRALHALSVLTGALGTGFHLYNVAKREGGVSFLNLFYGAPLGAPAAIILAGLYGSAASQLVRERRPRNTVFGLPAGPVLAVTTAAGMLGTVAEAALLHFRGAFHNPFMFLPVTLPPLSGLALAGALARRKLIGVARPMLNATALLGLAGVGFHLFGIKRNMGGFYNWSQNVLQGPPVPAPPGFTGVALAGLATLMLMENS